MWLIRLRLTASDRWLTEATDLAERETREKSDFLTYRNHDNQQADFHSLRHTYLSRLGRSGASPKVMQKLARHATVELTLGRYTHASVFDLSSAVNALPPLPVKDAPQAEKAMMRATGTDNLSGTNCGTKPGPVAPNVAQAGANKRQRLTTMDDANADSSPNEKPPDLRGFRTKEKP